MNIIELHNVNKTYRLGEVYINALKNANLKIKKGDFASVTGPSGCGKSTLLHLMGALDRPTRGSVLISGKNTENMDDNNLARLRGKELGFVFQTFNLIPKLTTLENVMLPRMLSDMGEAKEKAEEMLDKVGLSHRKNNAPTQLSGGERQRVAIARALVNEPKIILADEPTGNLDSKAGKEILKIFNKLHEEGNTFIIVTHDTGIASKTERKIVMKDGKILKS
jgi:putative ABC transport system ATP-binding protein